MKPITLRDIPIAIAERIQLQAQANGTSLNKTVIDLLAKVVDPPRSRRQQFDDLDHLVGSWSGDENCEVDSLLKEQRTVDARMWK